MEWLLLTGIAVGIGLLIGRRAALQSTHERPQDAAAGASQLHWTVRAELDQMRAEIGYLLWRDAVTSMPQFGPFAAYLARGPWDTTPSHLPWLNMVDGADSEAIRHLASLCQDPPEGHVHQLQALLNDDDWRSHLVAAVSILLLQNPAPLVEPLWLRIEDFSWVSPQLVAAASLVDPRFVDRANAVLASSSPGMKQRLKSANSLYGVLVELDELDSDSVDKEMREWLATDQRDRADQIAVVWRRDAQGVVEACRAGLRPTTPPI